MCIFDRFYRERFEKLSTTNVSDAMDSLGIKGSTYGIRPMTEQWGKVVGQAVTVKMTAAGETKSKHHLGMKAISLANPGDIIIIDNGGRVDTSCWGGILANSAKVKGVKAVIIDGACRDLDDCIEADFPVYARGTVVATARGRIMEHSTNEMIQFGGVQVRPGDVVMGDRSGVVVVPYERMEEVLIKAEELYEKEESMIQEILSGSDVLEVDNKFGYEKMLK
jgi:4-hydroxy-4-methyl-2-oxoglutarate aldolase